MRCCFVGDSFVNGVGDERALGWTGRTVQRARQAGIDVTAYDLGIRRDTSADVLARWKGEVSARFPRDVEHRLLFAFGANDCATADPRAPGIARLPPEATLANADLILAGAVGLAPTVMIGPAPIIDDEAADARIGRLERELAAVAERRDVPFLPIFEWCRGCRAWTEGAAKNDGTHPDGSGYAALAGYVLDWRPFRRWMGLDPGP